jgi:hypothetical protein
MPVKYFLPLLFLLPPALLAQTDFYSIDRKVKDIPFADAKTLAVQLSSLGKTEKEKARAIFRWITEHIDYNVVIYNRNKRSPGQFMEEPDDSLAPLPSLNERVAAKVLSRKMAFCDGYSRLFKTLCDFAGIKSEVISGYARTNTNRSGRFGVNHTWNAVYLDSSWHLLDVTWASGFVSYANEYVRQYNDSWFLASPGKFIEDHYPEELHWSLMATPPVYREFNQSPFRHSGYNKAGITAISPLKGVIDVKEGDTILIEMKTARDLKTLLVADSLVNDSLVHLAGPAIKNSDGKYFYRFGITGTTGDWLYVYCNEELVLRYKLNRKKSIPEISCLFASRYWLACLQTHWSAASE